MDKSIFTQEYAVLLELLRQARAAAGLTQIQLAQRLGRSQSFVTKMESGDRRLDLIQLRTVCRALGTDVVAFVTRLEVRLAAHSRRRPADAPSPPAD
jgi:transcriptional regulator with XRE-family HTH domain